MMFSKLNRIHMKFPTEQRIGDEGWLDRRALRVKWMPYRWRIHFAKRGRETFVQCARGRYTWMYELQQGEVVKLWFFAYGSSIY